jgi:outer membrane protein
LANRVVPIAWSGLVALTLFALSMAALLSGCAETEPLLRPQIQEELRKASALDYDNLAKEPAMKLENVPQDLPEEIYKAAKAAADPKPESPTKSLSLQDIRKYALENNLGLKVEVYNPSITEQGYLAEQAKFEAVFVGSVNYTKQWDQLGAPTTTYSLGPSTLASAALGPSIQIPTRAGGVASIGLGHLWQKIETRGPATGLPAGVTYQESLNLSLTQPLLRNAGFQVNYASINVAGLQSRQSDARTKLAAIRLLANVEQAYWSYYLANENLKIQVKKYELAEEQVKLAQRLVEEGVRTKVEVTRAEAGAARQFEAIIIAENTRRQTERNLKRTINSPDLPIDSATIIIPETPPLLDGLFFDSKKLEELAYKNRMELFDNELQQAIDRLNVYTSANATLPDLLFNFSYSFSGMKPKFNEAIDRLFPNDFNNTIVGLALSMPIEGNQSAKARLKASVLRQKQTLASRLDLELSISQEVLDALDALGASWQRILTNRTAVALAKEAYNAERIQFQYGFNTTNEVVIALNNLSDAAFAEAQALSEYQKSLVDLAFATGTVLGKSRVVWAPESNP